MLAASFFCNDSSGPWLRSDEIPVELRYSIVTWKAVEFEFETT